MKSLYTAFGLLACLCIALWLMPWKRASKGAVANSSIEKQPYRRITTAPERPRKDGQAISHDNATAVSEVKLSQPVLIESATIPSPDIFSGELVEISRLRNLGNATADGAFETLLWGFTHNEQDIVEDLIAHWTRQNKELRRQRVLEAINDAASLESVQIVGLERFGIDHVLLRVNFIRSDSSIAPRVFMVKRVEGKWYCI